MSTSSSTVAESVLFCNGVVLSPVNVMTGAPVSRFANVICSVPVLENLIETLTSCDDCNVELMDIESGCCGTSTPHIVPINKIWVRNGESNDIFKYKYSQFLQTFEEYHVSLKFAYMD